MKPFLVKRLNILARYRVDRFFRIKLIRPEFFAEAEEFNITPFDFGRIIVALLHALQFLLFAQRELILLKTRSREDFTKDRQTLVEILGKQTQRDRALSIANGGAEVGRKE